MDWKAAAPYLYKGISVLQTKQATVNEQQVIVNKQQQDGTGYNSAFNCNLVDTNQLFIY